MYFRVVESFLIVCVLVFCDILIYVNVIEFCGIVLYYNVGNMWSVKFLEIYVMLDFDNIFIYGGVYVIDFGFGCEYCYFIFISVYYVDYYSDICFFNCYLLVVL